MGGKLTQQTNIFGETQLKILKAYRDNPEVAVKQIAKDIGITPSQVYRHLKVPTLAEAVREIKGSVHEIVADAQRLAAKRMKRLILSDNENIALKASSEVLRPMLEASSTSSEGGVRFVTIVNDVGVLESQRSDAIDIIPEVAAPNKQNKQ